MHVAVFGYETPPRMCLQSQPLPIGLPLAWPSNHTLTALKYTDRVIVGMIIGKISDIVHCPKLKPMDWDLMNMLKNDLSWRKPLARFRLIFRPWFLSVASSLSCAARTWVEYRAAMLESETLWSWYFRKTYFSAFNCWLVCRKRMQFG